jgi:Tfp pilus assembly protein PilV
MKRVLPRSASSAPSGLTLVEVLMSMLVTGIGILSVIVLFPLAFVRAVQATNLTNGTILRYNAESLFDADPTDLVYIYPFWEPNTLYAINQKVLAPTSAAGNNHFFTVTVAGTSGALAPAWPLAGGTIVDGGVTWTDSGLLDHYVVDPLGALGVGTTMGNNPPAGLPAGRVTIPRFGGAPNGATLPSTTAASRLTTLPDSWAEQARGPVIGIDPTRTIATLSGPDLSGVGFSPPDIAGNVTLTSRIVMLDATGKNSQTRIITTIASPTVTWAASDPLPATFTPVQARVETLEQRYTWMLTVRRSTNGQANIDVTVFFRRPVVAGSPDEQLYLAQGAGSQFTVQYGGLPKPFLKKGGFMFDTSYAHWYRILDITNDTGTQVTVQVDSQRPQSETIAPTGSNQFGAVFMRGVVDVFPIGTE